MEYDRKYTISGPEGVFSSATTDYVTEDIPRRMSEEDFSRPMSPTRESYPDTKPLHSAMKISKK
jgi:hypothetical protein